jgi:hypothetical protein
MRTSRKATTAERDFIKRFSEMVPGDAVTHAALCRPPKELC